MEKVDSSPSEGAPLVHSFKEENMKNSFPKSLLVILIVAIVLGVGTGYMLSKGKTQQQQTTTKSVSANTPIAKGTIVGSNDTKTFKDTAEGTLQNGGIDGEGQYHLVRPGGDSQNVYLTSSSVDLSVFVGKKIKVWGLTQAAQHAGWLMDVGRVEVLE